MTDKAAREAFDLTDEQCGDLRFMRGTFNEMLRAAARVGYQAAHDAAMASAPDVRKWSEYLHGSDIADDQDVACLLDQLALRLQAAQHRAEIRLNDDGSLDEVVGAGSFQLEQMSGEMWFVSLGDVAVWLRARKSTISATYENRLTLPR